MLVEINALELYSILTVFYDSVSKDLTSCIFFGAFTILNGYRNFDECRRKIDIVGNKSESNKLLVKLKECVLK